MVLVLDSVKEFMPSLKANFRGRVNLANASEMATMVYASVFWRA